MGKLTFVLLNVISKTLFYVSISCYLSLLMYTLSILILILMFSLSYFLDTTVTLDRLCHSYYISLKLFLWPMLIRYNDLHCNKYH